MSMEMVEVAKEEPKIGVYMCHFGGNISGANEISFSTTLPEYNKVQNTLETFTARISKIDPLSEETLAKIEEKLQLN